LTKAFRVWFVIFAVTAMAGCSQPAQIGPMPAVVGPPQASVQNPIQIRDAFHPANDAGKTDQSLGYLTDDAAMI
jgi:hypothetical protein